MLPSFLALSEVLEIHTDQLARYGGAPGVRDLRLLTSTLAMPAATYGGVFLHADIPEMAAAYLYHLVKNHPFVDGNTRTGSVAALVFLALNHCAFEATQAELLRLVTSVADGRARKTDVTVFFERHVSS
ncbi:MAG: type II toxin-antitoxin system death-on-curing family toxin [Ignavibacteria bacterium]|nr:type II toxin-antitoxin system death-on-curing family toxin [Ignavibacteria bacterium]